MEQETKEKYQKWLEALKLINIYDFDLLSKFNEDEINDAFYKDLEFGTGGLRGVMGLGTNRMNEYVVKKASLGVGKYLLSKRSDASVAIGYDSRNNSTIFAKFAACSFASLGIKVYIYPTLIPTPLLSYAVRKLRTTGGVIVTASHNPSKYNGYKVYNANGCQIGLEEANEILKKINSVDIFGEYKTISSFEDYLNENLIKFINLDIVDDFVKDTLKISLLKNYEVKKVKIVYTPLNGTGLIPVMKTLKCAGFNDIIVPNEQRNPDGNFPTCPYPNPEIYEAMKLGISYANRENADLLIATDPDCDRCGIGVRYNGDFKLLSGNEVAILLLDFIVNNLNLPKKAIAVRSIVSTSAVDKIASSKGVEMIKVLTGFKFIGDVICKLEKNNEENRYIFGFEESLGYLTNVKVRDKDAVNASLIIAELFYYYKTRNINLIDKLNEIYSKIGFYKNTLYSHEFLGEKGVSIMNKMMDDFRNYSFSQISNEFNTNIIEKIDYLIDKDMLLNGEIKSTNLEKSNVLMFIFDNETRVTIRPSGTEPKIKIYLETVGKSLEESLSLTNKYSVIISNILKKY